MDIVGKSDLIKLCTKYGAPLTKSKCGNFYKDVRVQGHWLTWQHACEQFL